MEQWYKTLREAEKAALLHNENVPPQEKVEVFKWNTRGSNPKFFLDNVSPWGERIEFDTVADLLRSAWEDAANHKRLSFDQTDALRHAFQTYDKIVQIGSSLQELLVETETN